MLAVTLLFIIFLFPYFVKILFFRVSKTIPYFIADSFALYPNKLFLFVVIEKFLRATCPSCIALDGKEVNLLLKTPNLVRQILEISQENSSCQESLLSDSLRVILIRIILYHMRRLLLCKNILLIK